jgi:hypothetical protein
MPTAGPLPSGTQKILPVPGVEFHPLFGRCAGDVVVGVRVAPPGTVGVAPVAGGRVFGRAATGGPGTGVPRARDRR